MLEADILGDDVAAPGAAAHGGRRRHAVPCGTGVAAVVGLADHHTGDGSHHGQTMDVILIPAVDAAAVALAAHIEDLLHHGDRKDRLL